MKHDTLSPRLPAHLAGSDGTMAPSDLLGLLALRGATGVLRVEGGVEIRLAAGRVRRATSPVSDDPEDVVAALVLCPGLSWAWRRTPGEPRGEHDLDVTGLLLGARPRCRLSGRDFRAHSAPDPQGPAPRMPKGGVDLRGARKPRRDQAMTTFNITSKSDLARFLRLVDGTETTDERDERVRRTYGTRLIEERESESIVERQREVIL